MSMKVQVIHSNLLVDTDQATLDAIMDAAHDAFTYTGDGPYEIRYDVGDYDCATVNGTMVRLAPYLADGAALAFVDDEGTLFAFAVKANEVYYVTPTITIPTP